MTAKRTQGNFVLLAFGYLAVSIGFIAVIVGLMNWRLEATKETTVKGGNLVAKDGKVAKIQAAESFGQLYDLPMFDMQTLNQLKHVTVKLINGDEESFVIQRFQKRAGVKMLTLFDASGNTVSINAATKSTVVKVDGKMTVAEGTAFNLAKRRSLANSEPVLHSREEFFALRKRQERGLSAGSGHLVSFPWSDCIVKWHGFIAYYIHSLHRVFPRSPNLLHRVTLNFSWPQGSKCSTKLLRSQEIQLHH